MRWLTLVVLLACNGNNNGTSSHETTVSASGDTAKTDQNIDDVDPHDMQPGVFYCVRISSPKWRVHPCWRQLANCEKNRAIALGNTYDVEKCERTNAVFCFRTRQDDSPEWGLSCTGTPETCQASRQLVLSAAEEATECKRLETQRPQRPRRWRMAKRVDY